MKKRMSALAMAALLLVLPVCAGQADGLPAAVLAQLSALEADGWIPEGASAQYLEQNGYWEAELSSPAGEALALIRVDQASGRLVYFRRACCELPALPNAEIVSEAFDDGKYADEAGRTIQAYCDPALLDGIWDKPCVILSPEAGVELYTYYDHGDLYAPLVMLKAPEAPDGKPAVLAWVDLTTNPHSGWDGYLTRSEAQEAAFAAIRSEYGEDAADHAVPDSFSLLAGEYWCHFDEDNCPGESAGPFFSLRFVDPRADQDSPDFSLPFDDSAFYDENGDLLEEYLDAFMRSGLLPGEPVYEYWITLDAASGEVYDFFAGGWGEG